jgi:predicted ribosome quality control (RQC) complex YloA/Tae2 family protein
MQFIFKNLAFEKPSGSFTESQLTILRIPVKDIINNSEFIEFDESEISYYGKMYDICYKETKGDEVIYYCHSDENEDALNDAFTSFVQQNTNQKSDNPVTNLIKNLIKDTYFVKYSSRINQNSFCEFTTLKIQLYKIVILDVITPPPEVS